MSITTLWKKYIRGESLGVIRQSEASALLDMARGHILTSIQNSAPMELLSIDGRAGKVKLDGSVDEQSMERLIDRMATLYGDDAVRNQLFIGDFVATAEKALKTLEIEINSPGGSVVQGYRAFKTIMALRERGVHVTARITKLAASMGSVIAVAADSVLIEENAKMMIHDASVIKHGNSDELRKTADLLDQVSDSLAELYAAKTGKTLAEMRTLMKQETWMDANQAVAQKLADGIYKEAPKAGLDKILSDSQPSEPTPSPSKTPLNDAYQKMNTAERADFFKTPGNWQRLSAERAGAVTPAAAPAPTTPAPSKTPLNDEFKKLGPAARSEFFKIPGNRRSLSVELTDVTTAEARANTKALHDQINPTNAKKIAARKLSK